ncbi:TonB-dependent receptor [Parasphingorhabdus flavimaris]|uniref:TonB-dependent receptor n=3 Tax=Parasphingorhabdus flavimaris TaxID=266812 RepID=A0ABX2N1Y9_9SPHN|nr:TonB-dependent receptor [Parasphingorhabdus flavimaris]|tara:strand:- start:10707 stop:13559 length:2853 start_codon:yes stop_codon:yes gene_type:complete
MGVAPGLAHAQDAADEVDPKSVIVVTGSYIRGTPEDAAVPVDVYSSADLAQNGVSSPLEFIKDLPEVGSVLGDSNQFSTNAQGNQGFGSINLRNLGPTRTLVLFNGRRTLTAPGAVGGGFGDTNAIPLFALDRVEILKDGAAATYGSDAIAGVANFITKKGFEGVEIQGDYDFIKGSDNNYTASILVGQNFGDLNIMAGFGWQHRSELPSTARDYGFQPYDVNPAAWSALATPGAFIVPGVGLRPDVGCAETGGTPDGICRFSFIPFDNLIEEEDRYQGYVQADIDLTDSFRFRGEFTYAQTDLDRIGTSPGYPPLQGPGGAQLGGGFTVDPANPGAQVYANQIGLTAPIAGPIGIFLWRPFGNLGNPTDPGRGSGRQTANNRAFRLSGTLEKDFSETLRGQLSMTWATYERRRSSPGVVGSRLQDALNGLGGADCDPATGTPGVGGCQWFNPFINAGPGHPSLGLTNPFYVPGNENSPDLVEFLQIDNGVEETEDTFVVDLIFSGELGIDLGGGPVGWAAGAQYRQLDFLSRPLTVESNLDINPCVILGDQSCIGGSLDGAGSFIFLGGSRPERLAQNVKAVFAEVAVPISDTLEITAAARFEDYGGSIGSTFNPKGAVRWEPVDWLVLRGSVGTTFRGPLAAQVSNNANTALAAINAANGNFKAVDIAGNPTDLGPEKAFSYNLGAVVDFSGFTFSVDYWSFDFKDEITTTDAQAIASSVVPTAGGLANCSSPFASLITFDGGACVQGTTTGLNISRVLTQWVNGPKTKTSGLDFAASYTTDIGPGVYTIGVNASHTLKYDIGDFNLDGNLLRAGFSAVGAANLDRLPGTISPWRANAFINYNVAGLNLRYGATYIAGVRDERCDGLQFCATTNFGGTNFGRNISSYMQHDVHAAYDLPINAFDAQLQFSVENFTNEDASAARLPLGYNPFVGNTLGRVFRLGAKIGF